MTTQSTSNIPRLRLENIVKEFQGNYVLNGISLSLQGGEVHGLLGENGAGKSTLIKIITGVYKATSGKIYVDGKEIAAHNTQAAEAAGINAVYQDTELVGSFTVAETLLLGHEGKNIFFSKKKVLKEAKKLLDDIGIEIDVTKLGSELSPSEAQLVTLATMFRREYKILILDEPTARLSGTEVTLLFQLIEKLKSRGVTIIYISHRLSEISKICDNVTVLRDGLIAGTRKKHEINEKDITQLMIGSKEDPPIRERETNLDERVVLDVKNLKTEFLENLNFNIKAGEILGITGPVGGGSNSVAEAIFGLIPAEGEIELNKVQILPTNPAKSCKSGIALIPEDRRREALFGELTLRQNLIMPYLDRLTSFGSILKSRSNLLSKKMIDDLKIKPNSPDLLMRYFSGGNQQKAVIGKWIDSGAELFIFVEPTAGVDVGAIQEIYKLIYGLADAGKAVMIVSTSSGEILTLSDRVMVIQNKQVVLDAPRNDVTHKTLTELALGEAHVESV